VTPAVPTDPASSSDAADGVPEPPEYQGRRRRGPEPTTSRASVPAAIDDAVAAIAAEAEAAAGQAPRRTSDSVPAFRTRAEARAAVREQRATRRRPARRVVGAAAAVAAAAVGSAVVVGSNGSTAVAGGTGLSSTSGTGTSVIGTGRLAGASTAAAGSSGAVPPSSVIGWSVAASQSAAGLPSEDRARLLRMTAVSRSKERGPVGGCSGATPALTYTNGGLPAAALCALPFARGREVRSDAAVALIGLNAAYRGHFGQNLCLTDSYRSLAQQYAVKASRGGFAATPGTSEHGWGLAVDLCGGVESYSSPQHLWLLANAPDFGWDSPKWAHPDGALPEPWHWEFARGESSRSAAD
jgi:D-alanyl-D-alanine carboxypeptidase